VGRACPECSRYNLGAPGIPSADSVRLAGLDDWKANRQERARPEHLDLGGGPPFPCERHPAAGAGLPRPTGGEARLVTAAWQHQRRTSPMAFER